MGTSSINSRGPGFGAPVVPPIPSGRNASGNSGVGAPLGTPAVAPVGAPPNPVVSDTIARNRLRSSSLWKKLCVNLKDKVYTYSERIKSNSTQIKCLLKGAIKIRTGGNAQNETEIHANVIQFASVDEPQVTGAKTFLAGQSPDEFTECAAMLMQGLESGQGVFQFVSRRAHLKPKDSRENPIIGQLEAMLENRTEPLLLGERYRVDHFERSPASTDRDSKTYLLTVWDVENNKKIVVPVTQAGLKFTDAVLQVDQIKRANELYNRHRDLVPKDPTETTAPKTQPLIVSYAGSGRNATLISYRQICAQIETGEVTKDTLDAALEKVILIGREARGPKFVHSEAQLGELREALLAECAAERIRAQSAKPVKVEVNPPIDEAIPAEPKSEPETEPKPLSSSDVANQPTTNASQSQHHPTDLLPQPTFNPAPTLALLNNPPANNTVIGPSPSIVPISGKYVHSSNACYLAAMIHIIASNKGMAELFDESKHVIKQDELGKKIQSESRIKQAIEKLQNGGTVTGDESLHIATFLSNNSLLSSAGSNSPVAQHDPSEVLIRVLDHLELPGDQKLSAREIIKRSNASENSVSKSMPLFNLNIIDFERQGLCTSIEDALRLYTKNEILDTTTGAIQKQILFDQLPDTLPIALERSTDIKFTYKARDGATKTVAPLGKILEKVNAPDVLTIPQECLSAALKGQVIQYELVQYINHHGAGIERGHYDASTKNNTWQLHDNNSNIQGRRDKDLARFYVYKRITNDVQSSLPTQANSQSSSSAANTPSSLSVPMQGASSSTTSRPSKGKEPMRHILFNTFPQAGSVGTFNQTNKQNAVPTKHKSDELSVTAPQDEMDHESKKLIAEILEEDAQRDRAFVLQLGKAIQV